MKIKDILLVAAAIFGFWFFFIKKGTVNDLKNGVNNAVNNNSNTDQTSNNTTDTNTGGTNTGGTNTGGTNTGGTNTGGTNTGGTNTGGTINNGNNTGGTNNEPVVVEKVAVSMEMQGLYYSPGEAIVKVTQGKDVKSVLFVVYDQNQKLLMEKTYTSVPSTINIAIPSGVTKLNIWYTTYFNSGGETIRGIMPAASQTVLPVPVTMAPASQSMTIVTPSTTKFDLVWGARVKSCTFEVYNQDNSKIYTKSITSVEQIAVAIPAGISKIKVNVKTYFESGSGTVNAIKTYNFEAKQVLAKNIAINTGTTTNTNNTTGTVVQPNLKSAEITTENVVTTPASPIVSTGNAPVVTGNVPVEFSHLTPSRIIVGAVTDFQVKTPSTVKRLSVYVTDAKANKVAEKIFADSIPASMGFQLTVPNTTRLAVTTTASYQDGNTDIKTVYFDVIAANIDYTIPPKIWDPSPETLTAGSNHLFRLDSHTDVKKVEINVFDESGKSILSTTSEAINNPIITGFYVKVPLGAYSIRMQIMSTYKSGVTNFQEFKFYTV
jgi:hypothetical protein